MNLDAIYSPFNRCERAVFIGMAEMMPSEWDVVEVGERAATGFCQSALAHLNPMQEWWSR